MQLQNSLAAVALASLDDTERIRVEKYLAVANREPTSPPRRRPQQLRRTRPTAFAFESEGLAMATVALNRLGHRDRTRVEKHLALAGHKPIPPPKLRSRRSARIDPAPTSDRNGAPGAARIQSTPGRSTPQFLLYCFFKDGEPPTKVEVAQGRVGPNFVEVAGLELDVPMGAALQLWQHERWTTFTLATPLPRARGIYILFIRRQGLAHDLQLIVFGIG
ncbi:hypothetical protein B0H12DRAFT_1079050 [Mycena haematopus]|nr:hypothetical protein B0H12DRAFT_1079050 [Mycena haematopus]